jgi:hypothetical protein
MAYDGHIFTSTNGHTFPYIMKLDASGDLIWGTNCTTTAGTGGYGITRGGLTGNYFGMTWDGITLTAAGQGYDVFLARFNPDNGDIISLDGLVDDDGYADFGTAIARDIHDNFYVGGKMEHLLYVNSATPMVNEGPETDFFVAKFGSDNCDLGMPDINKPAIKAWPNPVKKQLNLNNLDGEHDFELYDAAGKIVMKGKVAEGQTIDMEALAGGIYLLRLKGMDDVGVKIIKE